MIYWLAKCVFLIWFLTSGPYVIKKATDDQLRPGKKSIFLREGHSRKGSSQAQSIISTEKRAKKTSYLPEAVLRELF